MRLHYPFECVIMCDLPSVYISVSLAKSSNVSDFEHVLKCQSVTAQVYAGGVYLSM